MTDERPEGVVKRFSDFYKFKMWVDEHVADPAEREAWLQRWTTEHLDIGAPRLARFMFDPRHDASKSVRLLCVGGDYAAEGNDMWEVIKKLRAHGLCEFDGRHAGTYFELLPGGALLQLYLDPGELP